VTYPVSKQLLSEFMHTFFGYGNMSSPYWFIGKEEGGGVNLEENFKRVLIWEKMGKLTTVDSIEYHQALGFSERELQKIQPTWTKLIQILLELEEQNSLDTEARRQYQRHQLGRRNSNHCTVELMPMASRSTGLWLWKDIFKDYFGITNRKDYFKEVVQQRMQSLNNMIIKYKPKLVLFYSTQADYIPHWKEIAGDADFKTEILSDKFSFHWTKNGNTMFVITPHPTAHGITANDFPTIGKFIKSRSC
jgi:hypothetical protein